jgi:hypothetical protein
MIFAGTSGGSGSELSIRQMILAEIPVPLCSAERILQAVLRGWQLARDCPGKGYLAIIRLYGPTEAAINKSWKPSDIEKVN